MEKETDMTEDNIFDIEIPSAGKAPNTTLLKSLASILVTQAEVCNLSRQVIESLLPEMMEKAKLSHIEFTLLNREGNYLFDRITKSGNHVPSLTMTGEDDTYTYFICINPDYSGAPPNNMEPAVMPKGASASLIRILKDGDMRKSWQYDFSMEKWNERTCMESIGLTERQFEMLHSCKHFYSPYALLVIMAKERFGRLSDEAMDLLFKKNERILTLAKKTQIFTSLSWLPGPKNEIFIRPLSSDAKNGLAVVYQNEKFGLYTSAKTELFDCAYETESMDEMEKILKDMLNQKFESGTMAIVPLSKESMMVMDKHGDCSFLCQEPAREISQEENEIFNHYLHLCAVRGQQN